MTITRDHCDRDPYDDFDPIEDEMLFEWLMQRVARKKFWASVANEDVPIATHLLDKLPLWDVYLFDLLSNLRPSEIQELFATADQLIKSGAGDE